jgi:glucokinase
MQREQHFLGVDIGGTSVKVGVVSADGSVRAHCTGPLPIDQGRDAGLEALFILMEAALAAAEIPIVEISGVGVAAPGTMDLEAGVILHPFNLPGWENLPLRQFISDRFGKPTVLVNDANAAAFGEYWVGGGGGARSLMLWTLGTGIGGGIVLNGEVLAGAHGHAGECGHMIIQMQGGLRSEFGMHGTLELYAGARGLVRRCHDALQAGEESELKSVAAQRQVAPLDIAAAAERGDELALTLVLDTARFIGIGTVNVMHTLNPEVVLLGGAMTFGQSSTALGRQFLEEVRATVRAFAFPTPAARTRIDFATLGNDAGFVGAAGCAHREIG